MKKFVCDRCGKDVVSYRRTVLGIKAVNVKIHKMTVTDINDDEKYYDLCEECYKEFKKFLSGKEDAE